MFSSSRAPSQVRLWVGDTATLEFQGNARIAMTYRCAPSVLEPTLSWRWSESSGATYGYDIEDGVVCDGTLQHSGVAVYDADPGFVLAELRLTGHTAAGETVDVGFTKQVWLRPGFKVRATWPVVLHDDGSLTVTLAVMCRDEWDPASMSVSASQGETVSGVALEYYWDEIDPGFPCDSRTHRVPITVPAPAGGDFTTQRVALDIGFDVDWDGHGGPFEATFWSGNVRVVAD